MLGRGGESNYHSGNIRFRQFSAAYRERYKQASKLGKPRIAMEVVQAWRNLTPPGRFLKRTFADEADSPWEEVEVAVAVKRAIKTLGERTQKERRARRQSGPWNNDRVMVRSSSEQSVQSAPSDYCSPPVLSSGQSVHSDLSDYTTNSTSSTATTLRVNEATADMQNVAKGEDEHQSLRHLFEQMDQHSAGEWESSSSNSSSPILEEEYKRTQSNVHFAEDPSARTSDIMNQMIDYRQREVEEFEEGGLGDGLPTAAYLARFAFVDEEEEVRKPSGR